MDAWLEHPKQIISAQHLKYVRERETREEPTLNRVKEVDSVVEACVSGIDRFWREPHAATYTIHHPDRYTSMLGRQQRLVEQKRREEREDEPFDPPFLSTRENVPLACHASRTKTGPADPSSYLFPRIIARAGAIEGTRGTRSACGNHEGRDAGSGRREGGGGRTLAGE
jgi:hypothetical protein